MWDSEAAHNKELAILEDMMAKLQKIDDMLVGRGGDQKQEKKERERSISLPEKPSTSSKWAMQKRRNLLANAIKVTNAEHLENLKKEYEEPIIWEDESSCAVYTCGSSINGVSASLQEVEGDESLQNSAYSSFPHQVSGLDNVKVAFVTAGVYASAVISIQGDVYMWGKCFKSGVSLLGAPNKHASKHDVQWTPKKVPMDSFIIKISIGDGHVCCMSREGYIYTWGINSHGQCGTGDCDPRETPTLIIRELANDYVKDISCGHTHTGFYTLEGRLFTFGSNTYGELGLGHTEHRNIPVEVKGIPAVKDISCGVHHTTLVSREGQVYTFGEAKILGVDNVGIYSTPQPVAYLKGKRISRVCLGPNLSVALTETGDIYTWGQTDSQYREDAIKSEENEGGHFFDSLRESFGRKRIRTRIIPRLLDLGSIKSHSIRQISCGDTTVTCITDEGRLFTCRTDDIRREVLSPSEKRLSSDAIAERKKKYFSAVENICNMRQVSCSSNYTLGLSEEYCSQRERLVWSLLKTERSYLRGLNIIVQIYFKPLKTKVIESKSFRMFEKSLTTEALYTIFGNVERILVFQRRLLNKLDHRMTVWFHSQMIGDIFLAANDDFLPLYTRYCVNTNKAIDVLNEYVSSTKFLSTYLQECQAEADSYRKIEDGTHDFSLSTLLLSPTMRIHKYLSYFKELLNITDEGHPDYENIKSFTIHLKRVVRKIISDQAQSEYMSLVAKIKGLRALVKPSRRFISQTKVTIRKNGKEENRSLLLYSDLLCLATSSVLEEQFPLSQVWIESYPQDLEKDASKGSFAIVVVEKRIIASVQNDHVLQSLVNRILKHIKKQSTNDTPLGNIRLFKYKYQNGDVYEGQWLWGEPHGKGRLTSINGEEYEGEWVGGKRHGHGVQITKKGAKYDGEWRHDKKHGIGAYYFEESTTFSKYTGLWVDGKRHNEGFLYSKNGDIFCSVWDMGVLTQPCCVLYADGQKYVGDWVGKKRHGYGVHTYKNKNRYYGHWISGMRSGQGFLRTADGTIYNGEWANDKIHGKGHLLIPGKYVIDGTFDGADLDNLQINNAQWMKSVPRDKAELNLERWNYFFNTKYEKDSDGRGGKGTQLAQTLEYVLDNVLVDPQGVNTEELAEGLKDILGANHPLGSVVIEFAKLFNTYFDPPEENHVFLPLVVDDVSSFLECMVFNIKRFFPQIMQHHMKECCDEPVQTATLEKIYPMLIAMYRLQHEKEDREMLAKMQKVRSISSLKKKFKLLGMEPKLIGLILQRNDNDEPKHMANSSDSIEISEKKEKKLAKDNKSVKKEICPFKGAVELLKKLPAQETPTQKIKQILSVAKEIEVSAPFPTYGADELLPILNYVVSEASLPCFVSELAFMDQFLHKHWRFEIQGCMLTHLQVVSQFLRKVKTEKTKAEKQIN